MINRITKIVVMLLFLQGYSIAFATEGGKWFVQNNSPYTAANNFISIQAIDNSGQIVYNVNHGARAPIAAPNIGVNVNGILTISRLNTSTYVTSTKQCTYAITGIKYGTCKVLYVNAGWETNLPATCPFVMPCNM